MILAHTDIVKNIEFRENEVNVVLVENKHYFADLIGELYRQMDGEEGKFVLSDNNKILNIAKSVELLTDVFTVDINNRKLLNALYANVDKISQNEDNFARTAELFSAVFTYLENITDEIDFSLEYKSDISVSELCKAVDLRFSKEYDSLVEKLADYLVMTTDVLKIKCFVFINLKTFLSKEELALLYDFMFAHKINALLLENVETYILPCENLLIIDEDLCEIY
jgi:CRISPR-associated protein Csn2